jgi:hypothetical protein
MAYRIPLNDKRQGSDFLERNIHKKNIEIRIPREYEINRKKHNIQLAYVS